MDRGVLYAGAATRVITPPVGVSMSGWNPRASGDIKSRYVHDDLYARALVLSNGKRAWALVAVDLTGVDAVATGQIRHGAAEVTGLSPETVIGLCDAHAFGAGVLPRGHDVQPGGYGPPHRKGRWLGARRHG